VFVAIDDVVSEDLAISIGREKLVVFETDLSVGFWLPILSRAVVKVVGTSDYNIVQNNGKSIRYQTEPIYSGRKETEEIFTTRIFSFKQVYYFSLHA
jgi:hypothetical protein